MENNILTYKQFGAVGDGVTDDFAAIKKTHEEANRTGAKVLGEAGATYLIRDAAESAVIRTDVDWRGARFILDDRSLRHDSPLRRVWIFHVASDTPAKPIEAAIGLSLTKGQSKLPLTLDGPCMLKIEDEEDRIYSRWGVNANGGVPRHEVILVDKDGTVNPKTPIQYDYRCLTKVTAYATTDTPITVENGEFLTVVGDPRDNDPAYTNRYCYFARGIYVTRSNTTLRAVHHDKCGEHETVGVPYEAFYCFANCSRSTLRDAKVIGHRAYSFMDINKHTGEQSRNEMGSYEINATYTVDFHLIGLTQRENPETGALITNRKLYHGIMGSNFCRDIVMENCYLDRFDSHQGVYNATIRNSTLGFGILVIGGGTLLIENVTRVALGAFIHLRMDYNSIFDGDVIVRNCKAGEGVHCLVEALWLRFYNGLPNHLTRSLTVDGLTVEDKDFALYRIYKAEESSLTDDVNPLLMPKTVDVRGMNVPPAICGGCPEVLFKDTKVSIR